MLFLRLLNESLINAYINDFCFKYPLAFSWVVARHFLNTFIFSFVLVTDFINLLYFCTQIVSIHLADLNNS